ncbi:MAG: DUF4145 domain-containing protein [Terracidiphilus sp.]|jgi:hypothetical protein
MFANSDELRSYVAENYPEVTDSRIDDRHWDLLCSFCKGIRGFQLIKRDIAGQQTDYSHFDKDLNAPVTYHFRCPVCHAFKQWIVYEWQVKDDKGEWHYRHFRVTSVPSEGLEDIAELPEDPPSLRIAYRQAIRAMDANANIAAAAMFRRALQVITRDLLGATPGNLAKELHAVVGKPFNGGVVTTNFANIGYIIKEVGNQGAHPDEDPDLLEFTAEDANDLQQIFMEVVSELFIIPAAKEKAKQDFMARRKVAL